MASSSSGSSIPAPEATQVLVALLTDESPSVRETSMASLNEIAVLYPLLVLDCCCAASRGGRRRFGNFAGLFQVMASGVRALNQEDIDSVFMVKLAKIATSEMISSKDLNADWQRTAAQLLVSIGLHAPDLMMEEIFYHLSSSSSALPAMVQILAEFASADALQFTPRLKAVLSRVLPIVGNVRDAHRPVFANAFKCWCQAIWQYETECQSLSVLDIDVMSFLNSAFELLLRVWATSRDLRVRTSTVEALGQMVGLITRSQLKSALPRLISTILDLYKKDQGVAFVATCGLHNILQASLLSDSGPPLLDFEDLSVALSTLLPVVYFNNETKERPNFSVGLKTYNEVQHCFLTVGMVYPDDLFVFLLNKCRLKEEPSTFGALCALKHLLPRLSEFWHNKRSLLVDTIKLLLEEQNLGVRKALSELIVVMASNCYLVGRSGELLVEYLVRHCALPGENKNRVEGSNETYYSSGNYYPFSYRRSEVKIGTASLAELRTICEKGLLLLTITIPEMEYILWPFLLKMIIPRDYAEAIGTVCRCISELCRSRSSNNTLLINDFKACADIPRPEELFARLVVLLHNPFAREQQATQILMVLYHLAHLFPRNASMFWQDEIPKMKAYVCDTDDLKQDPSCQETWDGMIINFLAESIDVIQDAAWVITLGNAFAIQYELYISDDEHSALLHQCLGILLQKVEDRVYVRDKIDLIYEKANISNSTNRLGLAKAMGLVAASHLDTVLDKLKEILDSAGQSMIHRFFSLFSDKGQKEDSDDIHAALALMYGFAARYAPSSVIEARINALVGTNMLSRLLHVGHPKAKQAVITAINLLGEGVINAAQSGASFPLKKRDQLLAYILTLMGRDGDDEGFADSSLEHLYTQALAINACTTLVSVEPKLTVETRNLVLKATLGFFALPNEPSDVIDPLIGNLVSLLCKILHTSGEDGRSRLEQLLHILRQVDQYVCAPVEYQRKRGCLAVHEMLVQYRMLCVSGYCSLGCLGTCNHVRHVDHGKLSNLPTAFMLPSRDALCLGERVIMYLPRCADTNAEVRKLSAQVLDIFFSISLSLPRLGNASSDFDAELSYRALSSLEDVIAILKSDASIDPSEVFNRVVSSICTLLTRNELVAALKGCTVAICDKVKQSAAGAIQAVVELVMHRGDELKESDVSRTTQSLLLAVGHVSEKHLRLETLNAICALAENTSSKTVFSEILASAGRDIVTKDISRLRGGWPMQDAFYAFSQHSVLSSSFLEHVMMVLNQTLVTNGIPEKGDGSSLHIGDCITDDVLQAAIYALTAFFRGGGKTGKKVVESKYASVLATLTLQLGSCHGLASCGQQGPLRALLIAFQAFCDCVGDLEMGKILARDGEHTENEKWVNLLGDLAGCVSIKRPKEIPEICSTLTKSLEQHQDFQREAAAAALSEFVRYSDGFGALVEQIVESFCRHVSDNKASVRRLCLRGLVQIPPACSDQYAGQVLGVILALLEDLDEPVQLTAVSCLSMLLELSPREAVEPVLLNLAMRLRHLQVCMNSKIRAGAFAGFGALSAFAVNAQREAFLEQVHAVFPRLLLHINDEDARVRQSCRSTMKQIASLIDLEQTISFCSNHYFTSEHRSDYEDLVRDLSRHILQHLTSRVPTYLASSVQAFDAPWPTIQANAIYFSSSMLSQTDDQRILALYYTQVFTVLVGKMSQSSNAIVRSSCCSALGMLLKSATSLGWRSVRLDREG